MAVVTFEGINKVEREMRRDDETAAVQHLVSNEDFLRLEMVVFSS